MALILIQGTKINLLIGITLKKTKPTKGACKILSLIPRQVAGLVPGNLSHMFCCSLVIITIQYISRFILGIKANLQ